MNHVRDTFEKMPDTDQSQGDPFTGHFGKEQIDGTFPVGTHGGDQSVISHPDQSRHTLSDRSGDMEGSECMSQCLQHWREPRNLNENI